MPRNDEVARLLGSDYGEVLWEPGPEVIDQARITQYLRWLAEHHGVAAADYQDLWEWSVGEPGAFWDSLWEYFGVLGQRGDGPALSGQLPEATWFPGATLNYARNALRTARTDPGRVAIIACAEDAPPRTFSYGELAAEVGRVRGALRALGVGQGDRVAAFLPNIPEALIGLLATASLGAIWSSCSPDFGAHSVIDRFAQIRPTVLFTVGGYRYGGKEFSRDEAVGEIVAGLPGLAAVIMVDSPAAAAPDAGSPDAASPRLGPATRAAAGRAGVRTLSWADLPAAAGDGQPEFVEVPFDHPLWVLYSSGTTGLPKAIMHGHGGIVLEHLKALGLHQDLGPGDVFFWYTTTGWMMWNYLASGLLAGTTVVLYDGSATYPGTDALWQLAAQTGVTYFGTGAPYLLACAKAGLAPGRDLDLSALRGIGSTGSPLPPEGFHWVYQGVSEDAQLGSFSGGTDVCTGFVGPSPLLPVRAGLIAGRCLGARVEAFDAAGKPVTGEVGELVITGPMPSMPVGFWNDPDGEKYRASYFAAYPGVWRHGDWIIMLPDGGCVIYGRSDATLNRGGVRMGTSEFYRVVERLPEVTDSLVVDTGQLGSPGRLVLYVVLAGGRALDDDLIGQLRGALRSELSPRHVPDEIHQVPGIPRTLSGKKLEVPVRKILLGTPVAEAADPDALANPEVLGLFAPRDGSRVESGPGDAQQSTVIEGNA
ncbi:MAG TPA: acetoacetate--CoA ligase [Streptosporangiaceae bacterium]|nr:acetoacetate--CoA ligase [Streptosporangiaceae bacterium]